MKILSVDCSDEGVQHSRPYVPALLLVLRLSAEGPVDRKLEVYHIAGHRACCCSPPGGRLLCWPWDLEHRRACAALASAGVETARSPAPLWSASGEKRGWTGCTQAQTRLRAVRERMEPKEPGL